MSAAPGHPRHPGSLYALWLAVGVASLCGWHALLQGAKPDRIADEVYHYPAVVEIGEGRWPGPRALPMFPGYHWLVAQAARPLGASLEAVRTVNLGLACLTLVFVTLTLRQLGQHPAAVLLVAWNPILFPFWTLVYTDAAGLCAVTAAVYLHVCGWRVAAAAALAGACLIRQSNIVWAGLLGTWAALEWLRIRCGDGSVGGKGLPGTATPHRATQPATPFIAAPLAGWPYWLLGVAAIAFFALRGGAVTGEASMANWARPNPAQFYLFGLAVVLIWLPLWIDQLGHRWRSTFEPPLLRPSVCAAFVGGFGLLWLCFSNPNPWNGDPEYLRNLVLIGMHTRIELRWLVAALLVVFVPVMIDYYQRQPDRALLAAVWGFSLLFLLPHYLVEPRYYIVPLALLALLAPLTPRQTYVAVAWHALLTAAMAAYVLHAAHSYGGVI